MNKFRFRALVKEFPFLKEILGEDVDARGVKEVKIQRIDKNLLDYIPDGRIDRGSWEYSHEAHLVAKEGVKRVHQDIFSVDPDDSSEGGPETVGEAIASLSDPDGVVAVVITEDGCRRGDGVSVRVAKPPKDWKLSEWIVSQEMVAQKNVAAEIKAAGV